MVRLAAKCYVEGEARQRALDSFRSLIANDLEDLDVEAQVTVGESDFLEVSLEGPDQTAASHLLAERWGAIEAHHEDGETYVGTLEHWDDEGFHLDAGQPVTIPAEELGLGTGSPQQIITRFGLVQHMPLSFVAGDPPRLADETRDRLYEWTRGSGRVNVNSATRAEVRATVNRAGHAQDIVTVERLGLLEQSIVTKASTDPPGLLSAIGPHLPAEIRCVVV